MAEFDEKRELEVINPLVDRVISESGAAGVQEHRVYVHILTHTLVYLHAKYGEGETWMQVVRIMRLIGKAAEAE